MLMKYIISVKLPNGESRTFQTNYFQEREGRIIFKDKYGQPKNFPYDSCFIEGVKEWKAQDNATGATNH